MSMSERSQREQILTDQGEIYEKWHMQRKRYNHIFASPNTINSENAFKHILQEAVPGQRVLEIGCGTGGYALQISQLGAAYVLALDISQKRIIQARQHEIQGVLDFQVADVARPLEGTYDVIVGRSVLHHLNYQEVLIRLIHDNLSENGTMLFYEPLGSNLLIRLYHMLSQNAHTPDEHPFERSDLAWLQARFTDFTLLPINYLSLPLGAISSFLFKNANNGVLRMADKIDNFLATHIPWLGPRFRAAIFIMRKHSHEAPRGIQRESPLQ